MEEQIQFEREVTEFGRKQFEKYKTIESCSFTLTVSRTSRIWSHTNTQRNDLIQSNYELPKDEPKIELPKDEPKIELPKDEPKIELPKDEPKIDKYHSKMMCNSGVILANIDKYHSKVMCNCGVILANEYVAKKHYESKKHKKSLYLASKNENSV